MAHIYTTPRIYTFKILWDDMTISEQKVTASDNNTAWELLHAAIAGSEISYRQSTLISIT